MPNQVKGDPHLSASAKVFSHPSASTTPCRNIVIHGYCKYADKGCVFNHDAQPQPPSPISTSSTFKKKLNADPPSFTPSFTNLAAFSTSQALQGTSVSQGNPTTNNVAAVTSTSGSTSAPLPQTSTNKARMSPKVTSISPFIPKNFQNNGQIQSQSSTTSTPGQYSPDVFRPGQSTPFKSAALSPSMNEISAQLSQTAIDDYSQTSYDMSAPMEYNSLPQYNQDMYYQSHTSYPLQYHLYAPNVWRDRRLQPYQRVPDNYFIENDLRESLQRKNEAALQTLPASTLPEYVHVYHSLVPLDTTLEKSTRVFGHPSWIYKACSNEDGKLYALRRIEGFRLTNEKAMMSVPRWHKLNSAGIVKLKEAFTTRAFGDNSLVFVYDYYAMSQTLMSLHFGPESYQQMNRLVVPEKLIWSYATQILSALRTIHGAKLAARIIEPSRILVTDNNRIRLNCCGIFDVIHFDHLQPIETYKQDDLLNLGKLLLSLCNSSLGSSQYLSASLANVEKNYSSALYELIKYIFDPESEHSDLSAAEKLARLVEMSANGVYDTLNDSLDRNSFLLGQLDTELENARLVRLLCKLGAVNERPEHQRDASWSETGTRYPLKLFRDYVFHQTDELGNATVDLGHMLRELNKLDAGIDEAVMLISRDDQTFMLVTYRELKECLGSAFRELKAENGNGNGTNRGNGANAAAGAASGLGQPSVVGMNPPGSGLVMGPPQPSLMGGFGMNMPRR